MTRRIAMWSGPRNLSTAMMYSFAARADTTVVDEPFYAAYLHASGADHPMRDAILASQPTDPEAVVAQILSDPGTPVFYQKHMTHHMVPGFPRAWMDGVTNIFLIRHPARVVASYAKKREAPTLNDLGYRQQAELFEQARTPVVVDATDIRKAPEHILRALCERIGIDWDARMLKWPAGPHPADGVWAAHWYEMVHHSTGLTPDEGVLPQLEPEYAALADAAMPHYEALAAFRIT